MKKKLYLWIAIIAIVLISLSVVAVLNKDKLGNFVKTGSFSILNYDTLGCASSTVDKTDCYCCDGTPFRITSRYSSCNKVVVYPSASNPYNACIVGEKPMWACVDDYQNAACQCPANPSLFSNTCCNGRQNYECYGYLASNGDFYCDDATLHSCNGGSCNGNTGRCTIERDCNENFMQCNNGIVQKCISGKWVNQKTCTTTEPCKEIAATEAVCRGEPKYCVDGERCTITYTAKPGAVGCYLTATECNGNIEYACLSADSKTCTLRKGGCLSTETFWKANTDGTALKQCQSLICGNGICSGTETHSTCPQDCNIINGDTGNVIIPQPPSNGGTVNQSNDDHVLPQDDTLRIWVLLGLAAIFIILVGFFIYYITK